MSTEQASIRTTGEQVIEGEGPRKRVVHERESTDVLGSRPARQPSGELDTSEPAELLRHARKGSMSAGDKRELLSVFVFCSGVVLAAGILMQVIKRYPSLLLLLPLAGFAQAFPSTAARTGVIAGFLMFCYTVLRHPIISLFVFSSSLAAYSASDDISRRKLLRTGVHLSTPLENTFLSVWNYLGMSFERFRPALEKIQDRLLDLLHRSKLHFRGATRRTGKNISELSDRVSAKTDKVLSKIEKEAKKRDIHPEKLFGERLAGGKTTDKTSSTAKRTDRGKASESLEGSSFTEREIKEERKGLVEPIHSPGYYASIAAREGPLETRADIEHGPRKDDVDNVAHKGSPGIMRSEVTSQTAGQTGKEEYM